MRKPCCTAFFQIGYNLQSNNVRKHKSKPSPPTLANTTPHKEQQLGVVILWICKSYIFARNLTCNLGAVLGLKAAPRMDGPKNPQKNQDMCWWLSPSSNKSRIWTGSSKQQRQNSSSAGPSTWKSWNHRCWKLWRKSSTIQPARRNMLFYIRSSCFRLSFSTTPFETQFHLVNKWHP